MAGAVRRRLPGGGLCQEDVPGVSSTGGKAALRGAPVAEKSVFFFVGTQHGIVCSFLQQTVEYQPLLNVSREIKQDSINFSWPCEEFLAFFGNFIVGVGEEFFSEGFVHMVGGLSNAGADEGMNALSACAEADHGVQAGFQNSGHTASPSGVCGTDDLGFGIGKEYGRTIGDKNGQGDAPLVCHQGVCIGGGWPMIGFHGRGAVDLVDMAHPVRACVAVGVVPCAAMPG